MRSWRSLLLLLERKNLPSLKKLLMMFDAGRISGSLSCLLKRSSMNWGVMWLSADDETMPLLDVLFFKSGFVTVWERRKSGDKIQSAGSWLLAPWIVSFFLPANMSGMAEIAPPCVLALLRHLLIGFAHTWSISKKLKTHSFTKKDMTNFLILHSFYETKRLS